MYGRELAATASPNAALHSWGQYASPDTWYWYTRILRWLSPVLAIVSRSEGRQVSAGPSLRLRSGQALRSGRQACRFVRRAQRAQASRAFSSARTAMYSAWSTNRLTVVT